MLSTEESFIHTRHTCYLQRNHLYIQNTNVTNRGIIYTYRTYMLSTGESFIHTGHTCYLQVNHLYTEDTHVIYRRIIYT